MTTPTDPTQFETYSPCESYCPPKGRLAVLGKARASIDKIRSTVEADYAAIAIQIAAQEDSHAAQLDSHYKIHADVDALQTQTEQLVLKTTQEIIASQAGIDQSAERLASDIALATEKTESETRLLDQKAITELAQTSDTLPNGHPGLNPVTSISGVIKKQKDLFTKQADGFDRDAEQKLSKILVDTWSVRQTTDGEVSDSAGVGNHEINRVLAKAKAGINV